MEASKTVDLVYKDIVDSLKFLFDSQMIQASSGLTDWNATADHEDDNEKIKQERVIAKDIMDHFMEKEFASIAYFFKKAPQPSNDHLQFKLTPEQVDYEEKRQERILG